MAKSAISANDLSNLRSDQYISNLGLWVTPLTTVQSGSVTAVPSLSPYIQVTWDGSTTGISVGQMVKIVNGTTLRAYGIIRKAPSGSTLYISETPLGSPGYSTRIESPIQVGDTVTVYSHRPLWNLHSRISDATFYKEWDVAYSNQNSQPPPMCNVGTWQAAILASGESTAQFTLPRGGVNSSFALGSATKSSYLWALPSGVSLATGYALTDSVIVVNATAGTYQVSCTLTDSNASTHTAYLWLFVSDGTSGLSLTEQYGIEGNFTVSSSRTGTELNITLVGDNLQNVLYPGAGILFRWWGKYNETTLTDGVLIDTFVGYIHPEGIDFSHDGNIGTASFRAVSPFLYAEKVGQPQQALEEVASPSHWAECTTALSNPRGWLYYAMKWHCPNIVDMHDVDDDGLTTPRRQFAEYNTNNLAAAMQVASNYIAGNVGSASDGTTVLRKYPLYMSNSDRNSLATIITWQEQDLSPDIRYRKRLGSQYAESRTGAFAYDGTAASAWLAGKRWHQGVGRATLPDFVVTASEGVTRVKAVAGHFLAEQNADIEEMILPLNAAQDVVDPVYLLWNKLTITSTYDPYGVGFSAERMLPKSVTREWSNDNGDWKPQISLSLQPETFGQPGEEIPIESYQSFLAGGWSSSLPVLYTPYDENSAYGDMGLALLNDDNGKFALCRNYYASSLTYQDLSGSLNDEAVCDFCIDWNSAYFTGNDSKAALGVYAVTISGATLNVWYFANIQSSTLATTIQSYTMNDGSCDTEARIEVSETTPTYVAVAWHDQTGTEFGYSDDGGTTWYSKANVGSTVTDTANDNAPLGLAVDGNYTLIAAPDTTPEYGVYLSSSVGGAFSALSNTQRSPTIQPLIKIVSGTDTAYVSDINNASSFTVNFDVSGFSGYTLQTTSPSTNAETATGNPGDASQSDFSNTATTGIEIDLGTTYTITDVTFDYKISDNSHGIAFVLYADDPWPIGTSSKEVMSLTPSAAGSWLSKTFSTDATSLPWNNFDAQIVTLRVIPASDTSFPITVYVDNIVVYVSAGSGSTALYKVSTFTGTDSWSDITPATDEAPERPHDLAIDLIDTNVIDTVSGTSNNWYTSTDTGSNWSTSESSSAKRAFLTAGDTIMEGGNAEVKISYDGGTTFNAATGNLASVWGGTVGVIKRVMAL